MPSSSSDKPLLVVTGSSGLIGARVLQRMCRDYRCVGLDIKPPDEPQPGVDFIGCDLTEDDSAQTALAELADTHGRQIASVVHLAAYYDFSGEPSPLYDQLTVQGTRRLLEGLRQFQVEQFIFSSSLLVMQPVPKGHTLDELSDTQAEWAYPQSKLAAEQVLQQQRGDIPVVVLRLAGVYDEDCHSLPIGQQMARIYERKLESYFFPGNKDHGQSFVHLADLAECIWLTVERRGELAGYEMFLIGEDDAMSYDELQEQIGTGLHGHEWPAVRIPKAVAKAGAWAQNKLADEDEQFIKPWMIDLADQNYPVCNARARTRLGWSPRHTLRGTIDTMVGRLRDDPRRWYEINKLPLPEELEPEAAPRARGG